MAWRLAKSLEKLRAQINAAAPGRSKASDGTIGDEAHASRSSDHNPWVKDGKMGVVTALDITHDPRNGVDCRIIADHLKSSRDPRIKYVIWNRRIWTPAVSHGWRAYSGSNPHDKHIHISVVAEKKLYDGAGDWAWRVIHPQPAAPRVIEMPLLVKGDLEPAALIVSVKAALVRELTDEAGFGPLLEGLVKAFQQREGLDPDGRIAVTLGRGWRSDRKENA